MVEPQTLNGSSTTTAAKPPKRYGITSPISLSGPTDADRHRNGDLEKLLVKSGLYESQEEAAKREEVLARIDQIVKGWVKQLTRQRGYTDQMVEDANAVIFTFGSYRLGIERDTNGILQCHPYPNEYVDTTKQVPHSAFFMGLQRAEGVSGQDGQQFDIRGTVDEFKHDIESYSFWKPGMDIFVSHVRRRQLPTFVFPEGYSFKRSRPSKQQQPNQAGSAEKHNKRKCDHEIMDGGRPDKVEKHATSNSPNVCPEISTGVMACSLKEEAKLDCVGSWDVDDSKIDSRSSSEQLESANPIQTLDSADFHHSEGEEMHKNGVINDKEGDEGSEFAAALDSTLASGRANGSVPCQNNMPEKLEAPGDYPYFSIVIYGGSKMPLHTQEASKTGRWC
ncbi:hypothetical protein ACFE04_018856 [Oxalis oulophora]